ncbi:MAG: PAS domain-containing protein, partial [Planctomycetaceae bacterium]|nr:PAS domain-containing protein [Planctomycetaceae bacterium]
MTAIPNVEQLGFDSMPLGCVIWDIDANVAGCNDTAVKMFALQDKANFVKHFSNLSPERQSNGRCSLEYAKEEIREVVRNGKPKTVQWIHTTVHGELIPCEVTAVPASSGGVPFVIAYINDLRKYAELEQAYELIQTIINAAPFGAVLIDSNFNIISCNDAVAAQFGIAKQDFLRFFPPLSPEFQPGGRSSAESAREKVQTAFRDGQCVFEWIHQKPDGTLLPTWVTLVRVAAKDKKVVVGFTEDVRQVKKLKLDWERERTRLLSILNSSPVCFAVLDGDSFKYVTPFMRQFLGIDAGQSFQDIFADKKTARQLLDSTKSAFQENEQEAEIVHWLPVSVLDSSGGIKEMLANMFVIDNIPDEEPGAGSDVSETIIWLLDVTKIRKSEAALRLARDAAEAAARTKSDFLANMSHEIRTPMNAVLGMLHLVLRTELTTKQINYVETAEQSAKHLLRIINDILDFSKIEAGRLTMEYSEFPVAQLISDLRTTLQESFHHKNLAFNIELDETLPTAFMGDVVRLRQVLINLLSNAVKFTEQGSVTLKIEVVENDALSVVIQCSVIDTGIGITPKQISRLFQPFSQADTSTTRLYGGSGLGLVIAKQIVELMKGKIRCESEPDKGTAFIFTARFGIPLAEEIVKVEEASENGVNALLVGGDTATLTAARNYLEMLSSRTVAECSTPEEFQKFLQRETLKNVDFILFALTDFAAEFLPVYEMLRQSALADNKSESIQVVSVQHSDIEPLLQKLQPFSPVHIIQKPIIASELFDILITAAAQKKEAQKAERKKRGGSGDSTIMQLPLRAGVPDSIRGSRILLAEDNKINQIVATELLHLEGFEVTV